MRINLFRMNIYYKNYIHISIACIKLISFDDLLLSAGLSSTLNSIDHQFIGSNNFSETRIKENGTAHERILKYSIVTAFQCIKQMLSKSSFVIFFQTRIQMKFHDFLTFNDICKKKNVNNSNFNINSKTNFINKNYVCNHFK